MEDFITHGNRGMTLPMCYRKKLHTHMHVCAYAHIHYDRERRLWNEL